MPNAQNITLGEDMAAPAICIATRWKSHFTMAFSTPLSLKDLLHGECISSDLLFKGFGVAAVAT